MEINSCVVFDLSNLSESQVGDEFLYNSREHFFLGVVMPLIMIPGIIGNVAFLLVYRRIRRMHTRTNIYLANLAVADVFYLVFGVGEKVLALSLSPIRYDSTMFSSVWCYTVLPFVKMCAYASMFFVTMVTVDKFFAVCHPFRVRRSSKRRYRLFLQPIKFVTGAWCTACLCAMMSILAMGKMEYFCPVWPTGEKFERLPTIFGMCRPFLLWADPVSNLFQISLFFIVLFPNVYMYIKIIYTLHRRVKCTARKDTQLRNYVARMLVINGSVFFLCTTPFYAFSLAFHIANFFTIPAAMISMSKVMKPISQALLYLNSCVNPVIYNIANPRYRTAFIETFRYKKMRRQSNNGRQQINNKPTTSTMLMQPLK